MKIGRELQQSWTRALLIPQGEGAAREEFPPARSNWLKSQSGRPHRRPNGASL